MFNTNLKRNRDQKSLIPNNVPEIYNTHGFNGHSLSHSSATYNQNHDGHVRTIASHLNSNYSEDGAHQISHSRKSFGSYGSSQRKVFGSDTDLKQTGSTDQQTPSSSTHSSQPNFFYGTAEPNIHYQSPFHNTEPKIFNYHGSHQTSNSNLKTAEIERSSEQNRSTIASYPYGIHYSPSYARNRP